MTVSTAILVMVKAVSISMNVPMRSIIVIKTPIAQIRKDLLNVLAWKGFSEMEQFVKILMNVKKTFITVMKMLTVLIQSDLFNVLANLVSQVMFFIL